MHPLTQNEIAKARSEEKLARGLSAYRAMRLLDERSDLGDDLAPERRYRLLERLRRRELARMSVPPSV